MSDKNQGSINVLLHSKDKMEQALAVLDAQPKSTAMAHIIARMQCSIDLLRIEIDLQMVSNKASRQLLLTQKTDAIERQDEAIAKADGRPWLPPLDMSSVVVNVSPKTLRLQMIGRAKRVSAA